MRSSSSGSQPKSSTSAPCSRMASASGSGSSPPPDCVLAERAMRTAGEGTLRPMFGRIDHIGVAVSDLDAAIELHTSAYGMELVHRETVESQGVEAVLLDVGENHVELLAPLGEETPVGKFLAKRGPGLHHVAYQVTDIDARPRRAARGRGADDRRAAAHRDPLLAGRVPASERLGRGAHRTGRAGRGARMSEKAAARRGAVGFQGGQVLSIRVPEAELEKLRTALREGKERWHEVAAADGAVLVDLGQVVYLRVDSDEHRVGF